MVTLLHKYQIMKEDNNIIAFFKQYEALKTTKDESPLRQQAFFHKKLGALNLLFDSLYGHQIKEELMKVYDYLCPDDEIQDILAYICTKEKGSGVVVSAYDIPGVQAEVNIRFFPTRIELIGLNSDYKYTFWQAA